MMGIRKSASLAVVGGAVLLLSGCGEPEPKLAGAMTESTVCSTGNLIVRRALESQWGENFRTRVGDCRAESIGRDRVRIHSAYENTALGSKLSFVAEGSVDGNTLRLERIQVIDVDDDFVDFRHFPG